MTYKLTGYEKDLDLLTTNPAYITLPEWLRYIYESAFRSRISTLEAYLRTKELFWLLIEINHTKIITENDFFAAERVLLILIEIETLRRSKRDTKTPSLEKVLKVRKILK